MSADQNPDPPAKKIKAYPYEATIEASGVKKIVDVIFVSTSGLIARLRTTNIVHVGEHYQVFFELPAHRTHVTAQVRVMKTYDRSVDPKAHTVERIAEFHFEALSEDHRKNILSFLSAIGQK